MESFKKKKIKPEERLKLIKRSLEGDFGAKEELKELIESELPSEVSVEKKQAEVKKIKGNPFADKRIID